MYVYKFVYVYEPFINHASNYISRIFTCPPCPLPTLVLSHVSNLTPLWYSHVGTLTLHAHRRQSTSHAVISSLLRYGVRPPLRRFSHHGHCLLSPTTTLTVLIVPNLHPHKLNITFRNTITILLCHDHPHKQARSPSQASTILHLFITIIPSW